MVNQQRLPLYLAIVKVALHLMTAQTLGFHRDELLYLALGRHLDWGYWSNPPLIGFIAWVVQHTLGDGLWATRLVPALCGGAFLWLVLRMVQLLGGGVWAVWITAAGMFSSIAWMRAFSMFQPVCLDILFWTWSIFYVLRYLHSGDSRWWLGVGLSVGLGMLNKYMLLFLGAALLLAFLISKTRQTLLSRGPWLAVGITAVLVSPNLLWQWSRDFPVLRHMADLQETQLEHVEPLNFLLDQAMFHGPGMTLWVFGLAWLFRAKAAVRYQVLAYFFIAVLAIFLVLNGKSYYTIGAYPVLFAAGGVAWESALRHIWARLLLMAAMILSFLPLFPYALPVLPADKLVAYFQQIKIEGALRWENGNIYPLPQDYADMLGWEEIGHLTESALQAAGRPDSVLVYGENYGQAGAAERFALQRYGLAAVSFSDSYRLWAPRSLPPQINRLIYINDELGEDVRALFADIQEIGHIQQPLAREYGTSVWLCQQPRSSFPDFWRARMEDLEGMR